MQSFEDTMDIDNCDIWQLKPLQKARSGLLPKQTSLVRHPLEDVTFDPNSQDSAYSSASSAYSSEDSKSQSFRFAEPAGLAPRRSSTLEFSPQSSRSNFTMASSPTSSFCRNLSNFSDLSDEGFMDFYSSSSKLPIQDENSQLPVGFNTLLAGTFKNTTATPSPSSIASPLSPSSCESPAFVCKRRLRRCLSENITPSRFSQALSIRDSMEASPISSNTSSSYKRCYPLGSPSATNSSLFNFKRCRRDENTSDNPFARVSPNKPGIPRSPKRMSTSSPRKHTISSSSPRKSTTGCDLIRSGKCDVLRRPVVMRRPEMLRSVSTTPKSTLFDYGFKKLRRSMSDSEATSINQALDRADLDLNLIGDFSKQFILPLVPDGKHHDLKNISPDTLARLIRGEFNDVIDKYLIIDCRYPYEYKGGHIQGALNIYTREHLVKEFIESKVHAQSHATCDKRRVLIFHCEYSAERGPTLSRYLRSEDRAHNAYPTLDYPEMYLLNGGYKQFYAQHQDLCEGGYLPMADPGYKSDFQTFRSKSKTWSCDYKANKSLSKPRKRLGI
ncbi:hypothetical protein M8J77_017568 [Diaphorina citri]|nr:hypothetical protein M8J77_017568 [Diaphorina citri]